MAHKAPHQLLAQLPPLDDLLRGSLLHRHTCHPPSVRCATCPRGQGHRQGVLNVNYPGGKNRHITRHPSPLAQVRRQLRNLDRVRRIVEQICERNQQQLRTERQQARSARD